MGYPSELFHLVLILLASPRRIRQFESVSPREATGLPLKKGLCLEYTNAVPQLVRGSQKGTAKKSDVRAENRRRALAGILRDRSAGSGFSPTH
jgi:hypothetical protein